MSSFSETADVKKTLLASCAYPPFSHGSKPMGETFGSLAAAGK